ncbi:hypothetical protein TNCT_626491 [Trichonephila clavata]|uniref:Uncharacterized protein n=1 Tax=Trichonephila clavata TaxID=2740835 RepID=A0A8X6M2T6_TRICU|nr:hypothetical protein TNCT_626491 [Trichonephila clavata]
MFAIEGNINYRQQEEKEPEELPPGERRIEILGIDCCKNNRQPNHEGTKGSPSGPPTKRLGMKKERGSANCFVTTVHTRMHPGMESLKSRGWTNTRLATCHLSLTSSRRPPQKGPRSRTTWNAKRKIS